MGLCCFKAGSVDQQYDDKKEVKSNNQSNDKTKLQNSNVLLQQKQADLKSIQQLRKQGKDYFHQKDYKMAIISYQKGLLRPDHDASFYTNLALAFKMNKQYQESVKTIQQMNKMASLRNHQNAQFYRKGQIIKSRCIIILVKQYCLKGVYTIIQNKIKLQQINSAIAILQEILSVPNTQKQFKQYIQSGHLVKQFLMEQIIPHSKVQIIQNYLTKKLSSMKEEGDIFGHYYTSHEDILAEIKKMVKQQKQHALQGEKDYLMDPVTYQMFINPVLAPSGQTYDQKMLKQHFMNNGYKDPITKEQFHLGERVIIKNNNLKSYMNQMKIKINKQDLQLINI